MLERVIRTPTVEASDVAPGRTVEPATTVPVGSPSLRVVSSRVSDPTVVRPADLTAYGVNNKIPPGVMRTAVEMRRVEHYRPAVLYSPGRVVEQTPAFAGGRPTPPHVVEVSPASGQAGQIAADRRRRALWIALGGAALLWLGS